jgi:hypothetical protein
MLRIRAHEFGGTAAVATCVFFVVSHYATDAEDLDGETAVRLDRWAVQERATVEWTGLLSLFAWCVAVRAHFLGSPAQHTQVGTRRFSWLVQMHAP